jgi:hypothetical protein
MTTNGLVRDMETRLSTLNARIQERIQLEQELVNRIIPIAKELRRELAQILEENADGIRPDLTRVNSQLDTIVQNLTSGPFGSPDQLATSIQQVEFDSEESESESDEEPEPEPESESRIGRVASTLKNVFKAAPDFLNRINPGASGSSS